MRISALAPLFVHETPEDPKGEAGKVIAMLADRRASQVQSSSEGRETKNSIDEETRAGLKRLSQLIRERTSEGESHFSGSDSGSADDKSEKQEKSAARKNASPSAESTAPNVVPFVTPYVATAHRALKTYRNVIHADRVKDTFGQFLDLAV